MSAAFHPFCKDSTISEINFQNRWPLVYFFETDSVAVYLFGNVVIADPNL